MRKAIWRQIKRSLAEQFRQIKRTLAEQFRQIKCSLAELLVEISFWFEKGDIPNEKIRLPPHYDSKELKIGENLKKKSSLIWKK